jgi:hypothetical protein
MRRAGAGLRHRGPAESELPPRVFARELLPTQRVHLSHTLRVPGFLEFKKRELALDARLKLAWQPACAAMPDWFKASNYLNI